MSLCQGKPSEGPQGCHKGTTQEPEGYRSQPPEMLRLRGQMGPQCRATAALRSLAVWLPQGFRGPRSGQLRDRARRKAIQHAERPSATSQVLRQAAWGAVILASPPHTYDQHSCWHPGWAVAPRTAWLRQDQLHFSVAPSRDHAGPAQTSLGFLRELVGGSSPIKVGKFHPLRSQ